MSWTEYATKFRDDAQFRKVIQLAEKLAKGEVRANYEQASVTSTQGYHRRVVRPTLILSERDLTRASGLGYVPVPSRMGPKCMVPKEHGFPGEEEEVYIYIQPSYACVA